MNKRQHKKMLKHVVLTTAWVPETNKDGLTILDQKRKWVVVSPRQLSKGSYPVTLWSVLALSEKLEGLS